MAISRNKVTVDFSIDETLAKLTIVHCMMLKLYHFMVISSDIIKNNNINMTFTVPSQLTKKSSVISS
jgi:hypothetical protein